LLDIPDETTVARPTTSRRIHEQLALRGLMINTEGLWRVGSQSVSENSSTPFMPSRAVD